MTNAAQLFADEGLPISDLHKDAYGTRPSESYFQWFERLDAAGVQKEVDYLCQLVEDNISASNKREADAWRRLTARMAATGHSDARAFWSIMPELGLRDRDGYDAGFWCYCLGISYDHETTLAKWYKEGRPQ